MPIPPEEYGMESDMSYITFAQIREYHTKQESEHFYKWMRGQTAMFLKSGHTGVYTSDYERWLREGKKTEQNPHTWD